MLDTLDPAIANDWLAVASAQRLAPGSSETFRLLGRDVTVARSADAALSGSVASAAHAPCHVTEHCGCIWVSLGSAPRPIFALPEFADTRRRFIYMGAIGLHTGGLRVVENFLDMAHFPYVHAHILGAEPITEVREYSVELNEATGELWARGCKFVQPMASAASTDASDVDYTYRVVNPFTPMLYKASEDHCDRHDIIFLCVQPVDEEECIAHFAISLFDDVNTDTQIVDFQQTILGQDKPILENHVYKKLPLDPGLEVPARADASSSAYRRWLRTIGLRYGVHQSAEQPAKTLIAASVARKWSAADQIAGFSLRSADGQPLPAPTPGAHLDVHLPNGIIRQYSLCNGPGQTDEYLIAVKREPDSRGGSTAMHDQVQIGDVLSISAPKNNFPLDATARRSVLIAGGIGVTPLLSMARHLSKQGREFELHYFCRSRLHAAFIDDLEREFGTRLFLHTGLTASETENEVKCMLRDRPEGTHVYSCGPGPLMKLIETITTVQAWPSGTVHFEYFKAPGTADVAGTVFEVRLSRSGKSATVRADQTVVEALRAIDVRVETNCEQGVCGTCLCTVLEGHPDHRDVYLTLAEKAAGTQMLPCVSRSRTPVLVLDL